MVHFSKEKYGAMKKFFLRGILHHKTIFLIGEISCTRVISHEKTKNGYFSILSNFRCKEAETRYKAGMVGGMKHFSKLGNSLPLKV